VTRKKHKGRINTFDIYDGNRHRKRDLWRLSIRLQDDIEKYLRGLGCEQLKLIISDPMGKRGTFLGGKTAGA
jgi:hypothetical protein